MQVKPKARLRSTVIGGDELKAKLQESAGRSDLLSERSETPCSSSSHRSEEGKKQAERQEEDLAS